MIRYHCSRVVGSVALAAHRGRWRLLLYRLLSLLVVVGMTTSSVDPNVVSAGSSSALRGSPAAGPLDWPAVGPAGDSGSFLYRTRVRLANPFDRTRLDRMSVTVLSEGADEDGSKWAMVLADENQLEDLARLRYEPRDTDEFTSLVAAHAQENPAFIASLSPLLGRAAEAKRLKSLSSDGADAAVSMLRQSLRSLTAGQRASLASFSSNDDDQDGLTNV